MMNPKATLQNEFASTCFPTGFSLHNIIHKDDLFAKMNETSKNEWNNEAEETTGPTVPKDRL